MGFVETDSGLHLSLLNIVVLDELQLNENVWDSGSVINKFPFSSAVHWDIDEECSETPHVCHQGSEL